MHAPKGLRGEMNMRKMIVPILSCALLAGSVLAAESQDEGEPSATIDLHGGAVAAGVDFVWGRGDLAYQGKKYPFKISGVSVADVGVAHITGAGVVYHLKDPSDFSGNYTTVSAGVTVAGGGAVAMLKNEHGVVIKLLETSQGLRFSLAGEGVDINLKR
jgi:hypothetical protein